MYFKKCASTVTLNTVFVFASVVSFSLVLVVKNTAALEFGSKCTTPSGEDAVCSSLYSCRSIIEDIWSRTTAALKYALKSHCGADDNGPLVCCGLVSSSTNLNITSTSTTTKPLDKRSLLPSLVFCGRQQSDDRFESRNFTQVDDFPWLVILHYDGTNSTNAGTLINGRYVLTAAHVARERRYGPVVGVTLGEYDVSTSGVDCVENSDYEECTDEPILVGVEEIVIHKDFNPRKRLNDIGLLRLERDIQYSNYIRPICLPRPDTRLASIGDFITSSGWGQLSNGSPALVKKKSKSKVISQEECQNRIYLKKIEKQHLCVKDTVDGPCYGDSGGPIMFSNRFQWHQEGITAFGRSICGDGETTVAVKVTYFMDWILDNIRP